MTKQNNKIVNLNKEQIKAIQNIHDILNDVLDSIYEDQDISLSQIKQLNDAYYGLRHQFNLYKEQ